jgi:hypothetical protein
MLQLTCTSVSEQLMTGAELAAASNCTQAQMFVASTNLSKPHAAI